MSPMPEPGDPYPRPHNGTAEPTYAACDVGIPQLGQSGGQY